MTATHAYSQLVDTVRMTRRMWRVRRFVEGLCVTAAVGVAGLTLATVLDEALAFGVIGRCVLAAALWAAVVAAAWRAVVRRAFKSHSDDYFAALLEHRLPGLGGQLINALQLGRPSAHRQRANAPMLVDAIVACTAGSSKASTSPSRCFG